MKGRHVGMLLFAAVLIVVAVNAARDPGPARGPVSPPVVACATEDSTGCVWDCASQGNRSCGPQASPAAWDSDPATEVPDCRLVADLAGPCVMFDQGTDGRLHWFYVKGGFLYGDVRGTVDLGVFE